MTNQQQTECYGMTLANMNTQVTEALERISREMLVMSMLSDVQELMTFGPDHSEQARQTLNVAKYVLSQQLSNQRREDRS